MDNKQILTEADFISWPVWKLDDSDDTYCKMFNFDELPFLARDLRIKTTFFTPNNCEINGYINGIYQVFCITLFIKGRAYKFNYNLPGFADKNIDDLIFNDIINNVSDLFPLTYKTDLDKANMKNFTGTFDVYNKELCKNEHSNKEIY